jgi:hypothetical protein
MHGPSCGPPLAMFMEVWSRTHMKDVACGKNLGRSCSMESVMGRCWASSEILKVTMKPLRIIFFIGGITKVP